jgi:hypothetical protein
MKKEDRRGLIILVVILIIAMAGESIIDAIFKLF